MDKISIIALFLCFSFSNLFSQPESIKQELINADLEFSEMSAQKGMIEAFMAYVDENGVLLRPKNSPVEGRMKIEEFLSSAPDTGFTLTWKPLFADVSSSGDLGYTYGVYEFLTKDDKNKPVTHKGTYVSIWKRDKDGKWKFVLDSGNSGLSN